MKKVNIQFKFSNRFLYTFIVTVIMILVGVTVFAYTGNVGHTSSQIDESDPTVASSVKDGVSWSELSGIPSGFADGTDNEGISGVSWSQISGIPSGFADGTDNEGSGSVSWNSITGKPSGFADGVDNEGSGGGSVSWSEVSGKPSLYSGTLKMETNLVSCQSDYIGGYTDLRFCIGGSCSGWARTGTCTFNGP